MITAVAFVPQAPALDPETGRGLDAELGPLRDACRVAIDALGASEIELVGDDPDGIGAYLLRDRPVGIGIGIGATALVVLGDGSARRSEKAPGYFDERAESFDAAVAEALRSGEPDRLAGLDAGLGRELLAAGVPAWHETAARLDGSWAVEVLYDDAPFGVGYFVAVWSRRA